MTTTQQYISYLTIINNSLSSGKSITFALNLIKNQSKSKFEKKRIDKAILQIKQGERISDALHENKIFDDDITSYIKIAESSSNFLKMLNQILQFLEEKNNFLSESKEKISMPIIYFILALVTIIGVKFYAIPQQIQQISSYSDKIKALVSEHLLEAHLIANTIFIIDILVFMILIIFLYSIYGTKYFTKSIKFISLHIPFVAKVIFLFDKFFTLLFLGNILKGGIDIKKSVNIILRYTTNIKISKYFEEIIQKMKYGESKIFISNKIFTNFENDLVVSATNSEQLGDTFEKISKYAKSEAYSRFTSFFRFLTFFSIFILTATVFLEFYAIVVTQLIIQSNIINSIGN
jgi:type II secretory pathway component PulF